MPEPVRPCMHDNGWYWLREDDPNDRHNTIITDKSRRRAAVIYAMPLHACRHRSLAHLIETNAPA